MLKIVAYNGQEYPIDWIGVATLDGVLRFSVPGSEDISSLFTTFSNPDNCTKLIRIFDEDQKEYDGYNVFRGITVAFDGKYIVALSKI